MIEMSQLLPGGYKITIVWAKKRLISICTQEPTLHILALNCENPAAFAIPVMPCSQTPANVYIRMYISEQKHLLFARRAEWINWGWRVVIWITPLNYDSRGTLPCKAAPVRLISYLSGSYKSCALSITPSMFILRRPQINRGAETRRNWLENEHSSAVSFHVHRGATTWPESWMAHLWYLCL